MKRRVARRTLIAFRLMARDDRKAISRAFAIASQVLAMGVIATARATGDVSTEDQARAIFRDAGGKVVESWSHPRAGTRTPSLSI